MPKTVNLVLTGRIAAGHTRPLAAAALAKMMHLPEARALELLAGKETVIKRGLDEAAAARYLGALGPIGAEVRVDEILQASTAAPVAAEVIKCPACGAEQPKRNLCRQCGGDIRRLLLAKTEAASEPPPEGSSASPQGGLRSAAGMIWVEGEGETPHPLNVFSLSGRIGRLRYLSYAFPAYLPFVGALIVGGLLGGLGKSMGVFALFMIVGGLATLWLAVRVAVLRLHDLNLSGKWILLVLVPLLAMFTGSPVVMIGSSLFLFLGSLALCFWPGNMMTNDYGAPAGPNTAWTIVGAVLFILLGLIGAFAGGTMPEVES